MSQGKPQRRRKESYPFRAANKRRFLASIALTGNVGISAAQIGIHRATHYVWLKEDPDYAAAFAAAMEDAADHLEAEARRRAVEGWIEPVFYRGKEVGGVRKYSDTLLIGLLKGARPEKYRDRVEHAAIGEITVVHSIPSAAGEPLTVQVAAPEALSGGA